jgi:hypothetical protein
LQQISASLLLQKGTNNPYCYDYDCYLRWACVLPEINVPLACKCIGNSFLLVTSSIEHISLSLSLSLSRRGISSYTFRSIGIYPTHALYDNIRQFMRQKFRLLYLFCCQLMYLRRKLYFVLYLQTKVKPSLSTSWRRAGELQVWLHSFLTRASVNFTPRPLYSRKEPGTHWIWGCVGPGSDMDNSWGREKSLAPVGSRTSDRPVRRLVDIASM